ncbi:hypothetical protein NMG60_11025594 [Bertholletia excelsa]
MTTVKGLLKGLRYISQMFDEKEEEIKIGYPTDVKHVAHIGSDGATTTTPSWPTQNHHYPLIYANAGVKNADDPVAVSPTQSSTSKRHTRRHGSSGGSMGSPARDPTKPRRRKNSGELDPFAPMGSPARDPSKPRRHKNSGDLEGSIHRARRHHNSHPGSESPSQDLPEIPKARRKSKSKDTTGGGSNRVSRSKGSDSLPENYVFSDPTSDLS